MNVLCLDLELNKLSPAKIIQIGYVVFNVHTGIILKKQSLMVDPKEEITPFITTLTKIHQADVDGQPDLMTQYKAMVVDMKEFQCNSMAMQWGQGDLKAIHEQLLWDHSHEDIDWPFSKREIDVKALFQIYCILSNHRIRSGLAKAMTRVGLNFKGTCHRADDDAHNTAILFLELAKHIPRNILIK